MREFKNWMSDCQEEWERDPMFNKASTDGQVLPYKEAIKVFRPQMLRGCIRGSAWEPVTRARILDPNFEYIHSSKTDVQKTWRKFGWVPLAEVTK